MRAASFFSDDQQQQITTLTEHLDTQALLWLSGYLAGLARNRTLPGQASATGARIQAPAQPVSASQDGSGHRITVLYGSQTGNAKRQAEALWEACQEAGAPVRLVRADQYPTRELKDETLLYVVVSTQGEGDPPDDAIGFVEFLKGRRAPRLPQLKFAVLGLGDSSYPEFCGIAQQIDARLAELGAERLQATGMADVDIETVAAPWRQAALAWIRQHALADTGGAGAPAPTGGAQAPSPGQARAVTREQPIPAELLANQRITGRGSEKAIHHLELSLAENGLSYQAGDALGVWPVQDDALVERILEATGLDPAQTVPCQGEERPLGEWLKMRRELTVLTRPFIAAHAERAGHAGLAGLLQAESRHELAALMSENQVLDILQRYPAPWSAGDLVSSLRALAPRLYSIASSPSLYEDEVHLVVASVAYERDGQPRWGVASRHLCSLAEGDTLPVYIEANERFRLPDDGRCDILMIGAGTGVAPFRAFVQERQARGDAGRNWLFFGNPHFQTDFLYQTEWQQALKQGSLHRIDLAFSRDQADKIYVQHRLLEQGAEVYKWIESGGRVYVCGDAARMAPDVQQALLQIAQRHGGLGEEAARSWLETLASQGRYVRDVY